MKFGRAIPYGITIEPTANMGFAVHVGCCHVVFTEKNLMLDALAEYLADPKGMEREYNRNCGGGQPTLNRPITQGDAPDQCCAEEVPGIIAR